MNKYTLWTLNAAENLIDENELEEKFEDTFILGNRPNFNINKKSSMDKSHNLMPLVEYFVPIAVKCLGNRFEEARLKDVKNYFYNTWVKDKKRASYAENLYKSFWEITCGPDTTKKETSSIMVTKNYLGYYDILLKTSAKNKCQNILIGYSQGGVVARYLAWLDEYIFKENIIKAIITVQSPNWGSPFANPDNAEKITNGLLTILTTTFSFYLNLFPHFNKYLHDSINFENILNIFLKIKYDLENLIEKKEEAKWLYEFIITSIKWLSGLCYDNYDTAFYDLNIIHLHEELSILATINNNLVNNIYYGAIISTNNEVKDIIKSIIDESKHFRLFIKILYSLFLKQKLFMGFTFEQNLNEATQIFKELFVETNFENEITKYYISGIKTKNNSFKPDKEIKPYSHDFVIPASYQLLKNNEQKTFMGNFVNYIANHNTGKSKFFKAGQINSEIIYKMLENIIST